MNKKAASDIAERVASSVPEKWADDIAGEVVKVVGADKAADIVKVVTVVHPDMGDKIAIIVIVIAPDKESEINNAVDEGKKEEEGGSGGTDDSETFEDVYLYYEGIFNHEFGHTMHLPHHYDSMDYVGDGMHMPPGETQCILDRNSYMFCSACRTALGIPLDISNTTDIEDAMDALYP